MKKLLTILYIVVFSLLYIPGNYAQSAGDYRSDVNGNWSAAATWETFDGANWIPAAASPTGSEDITINDTVTVDVSVAISGDVQVEGTGLLTVGAGSLTFNSGSSYEHARNAGTLPTATWESGSTCLITGVTANSPGNANQNFYNFTWNCTGQTANLNLAWSGNTIGGNLTCNSSGSGRFQMSNNTAFASPITINGDVIVTGGVLTSNGSSGAQTYSININGNVNVTGGNFSLSRGSGGIANWYLFGDFSVSNAIIQTSNNSSKFVFAAIDDTQQVSLGSVSYTGTINYEIDSAVTINIIDNADSIDMAVNGTFTNLGSVLTTGRMSFENNSVYNHARAGGSIPIATWRIGSTCELTGITGSAPANGNQSFYNVIWNNPNQTGNLNLGWRGITIGGNITVLSTGASGRWNMCAPQTDSTAIVTIMGDITLSAGNLTSNGTGNGNTTIVFHHYGDIKVTAGNFSVSRGSQGGTGTTTWNLYGDSILISNTTTQNSNAAGAKFVFAGTNPQVLRLTNVTFGSGGMPVQVSAGAALDLGISQFLGSGIFIVDSSATLRCGNAGGLDSALQNTGTKTLSAKANYTFNGAAAQITGILLPSTVNNLTIDNSAGVTLSGNVQVDGTLNVGNGDLNLNGKTVTLGGSATLTESPGNTVTGTTGKITTTRNLNAPSGVNVGGLGIVLTTSVDLGSATVERFHSAAQGSGNVGIFRQFIISPTNNSALNATLRFYYDESELNGIPEANLTLFTSNDGTNNSWNGAGGTVNTTDNYVELSGISNLSYWTLGDISNPVPVELTSFSSLVAGQNVTLKWTTATETNNRGWDIERRMSDQENVKWEKAGFVTGNGSKSEISSYSFTDKNLAFGQYQYRLKQLDYDGRFDYSKIVEAEIIAPTEFTLYQNYPNPFNPYTVIRFDVPENSFVNISIYNSLGEKVATLLNEQLEQGVYFKNFDGSNLSTGIYLYQLTAGDQVFTKKMLMIK